MKKYINILVLVCTLFFLAACDQQNGNSKKSQSTAKEAQVRLVVKTATDKTDEKVNFKNGQTVMDVLKANYKVKESNDFITSIDGLSQDKKAGRYWMFKVNGKLAAKSADKIKVKKGDKIEFYQEVYQKKTGQE